MANKKFGYVEPASYLPKDIREKYFGSEKADSKKSGATATKTAAKKPAAKGKK